LQAAEAPYSAETSCPKSVFALRGFTKSTCDGQRHEFEHATIDSGRRPLIFQRRGLSWQVRQGLNRGKDQEPPSFITSKSAAAHRVARVDATILISCAMRRADSAARLREKLMR
jgi:hypothetical protein